jgi:hypothetical protein
MVLSAPTTHRPSYAVVANTAALPRWTANNKKLIHDESSSPPLPFPTMFSSSWSIIARHYRFASPTKFVCLYTPMVPADSFLGRQRHMLISVTPPSRVWFRRSRCSWSGQRRRSGWGSYNRGREGTITMAGGGGLMSLLSTYLMSPLTQVLQIWIFLLA